MVGAKAVLRGAVFTIAAAMCAPAYAGHGCSGYGGGAYSAGYHHHHGHGHGHGYGYGYRSSYYAPSYGYWSGYTRYPGSYSYYTSPRVYSYGSSYSTPYYGGYTYYSSPGSTIVQSTEIDPNGPALGIRMDVVEQGVLVDSVYQNSPAWNAGIRAGDVITAIDGRPMRSTSEVLSVIHSSSPGASLSLQIQRDGSDQTLSATLGARSEVMTAENAPRDSASDRMRAERLREEIAETQRRLGQLREQLSDIDQDARTEMETEATLERQRQESASPERQSPEPLPDADRRRDVEELRNEAIERRDDAIERREDAIERSRDALDRSRNEAERQIERAPTPERLSPEAEAEIRPNVPDAPKPDNPNP